MGVLRRLGIRLDKAGHVGDVPIQLSLLAFERIDIVGQILLLYALDDGGGRGRYRLQPARPVVSDDMGRALGHVLLAQRTIFADDGHRGTARCLPGIVPYPGDVILRPLLNQPDPLQHVGDVIYATLLHLQLLGGGVQIEGTIGSLGLETGARFVVRDPVRRGPLEQVNELFRQQPEGGVESTVRRHEAGREDGDAVGA